MRRLFLLAVVLLFNTVLFAQKGKVEGKVTDANTGQALAGVSVVEKSSGKGVATNADGRYIINVEGKTVSLVFSYNGVTQQVDGVEIQEGKVTTQDLAITPKTKTEEGVVVRATSNARKETAAAIISFQKNTNTVASVISAESIKRSPDKNTGEVLKRTPGASIQEGRFIVVRGLADRYNQAMLNGILLTSTEPDRKTFSFDLIPAPMIDNIIINKAFVPEYPGEWAGGLIQVNTKDIPSKGFFNVQIGTGFNSQTIGKDFYRDGQGGKTDWLGFDDGTRALPSSYTKKSEFDLLPAADKAAIGKQLRNSWAPEKITAPLMVSFQANAGFTKKVWGKQVGGIFGILYQKSNRYQKLLNRRNNFGGSSTMIESSYDDDKYLQEVTTGAIGNLTAQLNARNKVSLKGIINVNNPNYVTQRKGYDIGRNEDLQGSEFTFKQNTFFTTQLSGEHTLITPLKLKWYGAFNILDGYIPDQRRILYSKDLGSADPYKNIISRTLSQQNGSRIYQNLSDYIYTAGGDLNYNFDLFGQKQAVKGGYMLQIKDRLYDGQFFANYMAGNDENLKLLPASQIFAPENFGNGVDDNKIGFDAIKNKNFRYMANTILNAGFLQFDNQFSSAVRVVWGLRVEDYDQLIGSVKTWDDRYNHTRVTDFLPGLNATLKLNKKTNLRLSASQTVIRPELRELASLNIYDFELNASVQGNPDLKRTKVSNADLRYEYYPRPGEVFTLGVFYKNFKDPIEQLLDEQSGGASTFSYVNAEKANNYGVELEVRKKLDFSSVLKNFTFQANAAYIKSRVKSETFSVDRPMQGQSPYLLNFGLLYDLEKAGLNATVLFNQIGKRIYVIGTSSIAVGGAPDVYEASRPLLDFQVAKKILAKRGELRLNISDILNQTQYFYQNADDNTSFDKNKDAYRFTRKLGTNYSLTFNYSIK
ncbi:MAG: carboxypeptidase-like regulatory domain-containing protein [Ferruginibacter sp.]